MPGIGAWIVWAAPSAPDRARRLRRGLDHGRRAAHHVQLEVRGLHAQLVQVRFVDQPQDLADVVVGERHQGFLPTPKVPITRSIADFGATGSRRGATVTGRDCRTNSSPSPRDRPLDVLMAAEVPLDAAGDLGERVQLRVVETRRRPGGSAATSTRSAPSSPAHVLDPLGRRPSLKHLTGDLAERYSSGVTSPPTTASPSPQLAFTATLLGSPLTGLQVNMTPETEASTITWTVTPIAGGGPPSRSR